MKKNNIFILTSTFFITGFINLIIAIISYEIFIQNFVDIEKEQNLKNIHVTLNIMDVELKRVDNITNDYAKWDKTYAFIENKNQDYIYDNFREDTNTLKELNLDFMIYVDAQGKKVFSKFSNNYNLDFENKLLNTFRSSSESTVLYAYEEGKIPKLSKTYFIVTKKAISNSDNTLKSNGFIYSGHHISNNILNRMTKVFKKIKIQEKKFTNNMLTMNTNFLRSVKIKVKKDSSCDCLKNTIQFFDNDGKYVFSLITENKRELIKKGNETILYYNLIIFFFLFVIFFFVFKSQKLLKNYNIKLKKDVYLRTKELEETNKKLKILAEQDELTQINNRRNFFTLGKKVLFEANSLGKNIFVSMLDLDDFKKINDTYGHDVGDIVLKEFCSFIKNKLDNKHIFGRLGGEEFAILFKDISFEEVFLLNEVIKKGINSMKIKNKENNISFTVSIGLVSSNNNEKLDVILKQADDLLYKAKKRGKNCIVRS